MNDNTQFIIELLDFLDPSLLTYEEWIKVGFALKEEGFSLSVWDEWSKKDSRYHVGECERKWKTFSGNLAPVTGGTIYELARSYGFTGTKGKELEWDSVIGGHDDMVIVRRDWLEAQEIKEPESWNPREELIRYLSIFDSTENVGYVTEVWNRDGKYMPTSGCFDRTAGELIELLTKSKDICDVIGDYNKEAGAWIRFNPLDGKGVKNENVTEYRFALVESDSTEIEKQMAIIKELELPCAVIVHSGGKSLHAIVKIDAGNYDEYRTRVDFLYNICQKNGLSVDRQNKNPSRLSRMPGIERSGKKQFIVDMNSGKASFNEWKEWIEGINDDLPDPESLSGVWDDMPELAPELISGVLRQGHKMLVSGPSKAGKSFALIELCIAIAEGAKWLDLECTKGRVMYINLELDRASCLHRFKDVYDAMGLSPEHISNIDIWNLRGKTVPMDKLAPKLIRRAHKKNYIAVVIDPIYKVITGDENSAEQMSYFCNQFDKVCTELQTAVIYCHHHSKGSQGQRKSIDRASGSGVFARDPDALCDFTELDITEAIAKTEINKATEKICMQWLTEYIPNWQEKVSRDDLCSYDKALEECRSILPPQIYMDMMEKVREQKEKLPKRSAWRIECTLREFPKMHDINVWFDYPVHRVDENDCLSDVHNESASKPKTKFENKPKYSENDLIVAYDSCAFGGDEVRVKDIASYLNVSLNTAKTYIDKNAELSRDKKGIVSKCQNQ